MLVVIFGLAAAVLYGAGDFGGGLGSRRYSAVTVLLYAYPVGVVLMSTMLALFPGTLTAHAALFGVVGGVAGLIGVMTMYSLMAVAPMNIISPVTAVLAAMVPVVFGVIVGERPGVAAWFGIALGLAAITLVSRTTDDHPHGNVPTRMLLLACVSGLGFGFYFIFLARAGHDSGLWPLVVSRFASALLILPIAARRHAFVPVRGRMLAIVLASGACDALANMCFLLASRHGLLSLASVLTALYPATTVILAVTLLHEHTSRVQRAGLGLAAASIVLITI